ncbi:HAD family hydrolase [Halocatena halophila]|uniref:HAD family hydrolase n=1 Tax=Halocatena halophila TaxID=2814576 RepID=UPI002ED2982B
MTQEITTVLFDLDDTLCEYRQSVGDVLEIAHEEIGIEPLFEPAEYVARYDEFAEKTDSSEQLRRECFSTLAAEHDRDPDLGRAVARAYSRERDQTDVRPFPGAIETLETLSESHSLGLITNGVPDAQRPKLDVLGLEPYFDIVLFAGSELPAKPARAAFDHALDHLGSTAARSVHVGNSLESDVVGAQRAGIDAIWFVPYQHAGIKPDPRPAYTVESIPEVLDVVESSL